MRYCSSSTALPHKCIGQGGCASTADLDDVAVLQAPTVLQDGERALSSCRAPRIVSRYGMPCELHVIVSPTAPSLSASH
eukprot:scaffold2360_cov380-Prasinococcus_capsulatus_cf.AAC.20